MVLVDKETCIRNLHKEEYKISLLGAQQFNSWGWQPFPRGVSKLNDWGWNDYFQATELNDWEWLPPESAESDLFVRAVSVIVLNTL